MTTPKIIAHRGAILGTPEHSIASCQRVIELGVDMIEFDVRRTKDNVLIAYHDKTISHRYINHLTYRKITEIGCRQGLQVVEIAEILKLAQGRIHLDIELKEEGYEQEVIELVLGYLTEHEFIITSFNHASLLKIKVHYPEIKTGLLFGRNKLKHTVPTRILETLWNWKQDDISTDFLAPNFRVLHPGFLEKAKMNSQAIVTWTVNQETVLRKLIHENQVHGIVTDRADLALFLRNKMKG